MSEDHDDIGADADGATATEGSRFAKAHHILLYFLGAVLLVWMLSGFYQVKADEIAIVERLGQYLQAGNGKTMTVDQGLHYHLPWPVDRVHKISTQQTATLRVTEFDMPPDAYSDFRMQLQREQWPADVISAWFDPYMITGDKSVIHMDISVVYRINDPEAWLNTVSHADMAVLAANDQREALFQRIAQRAMIGEVSHMTMEQVLFSDLGELATAMQGAVEKGLKMPRIDGQMGVQVMRVDIVRSRPPDRVKPAFNQVSQAKSKREEMKSMAQSAYDSAVTKAEGERLTLVTKANQYATEQTNGATGEAQRFKEVWAQYKKSPETTQFNMYADAANTVLSGAKRLYRVLPGHRLLITVDPPQYDANQVVRPAAPPGG
jgi:membrane protease subunit HflK